MLLRILFDKISQLGHFLRVLNKKGILPIFIGLVLIISASAWQFHRTRILSFTTDYPAEIAVQEQKIGALPRNIYIPKVNLDLPIREASIKDGVWEIWHEGATHLDQSANPTEGGNIVVYGHNKTSLFGPIRWLSIGDTIEVTDVEEKIHTYVITDIFETTPEDISPVLPKDEEVLTLYTCSGFFDQNRYFVVAKPIAVNL